MSFLSGLPDEVTDTVTKLIENIQSVEDNFKESDELNFSQLSQVILVIKLVKLKI